MSSELEQQLGIEFPADCREIVNAKGSIEISGRLHCEAAREAIFCTAWEE
ncbi:hypothetical protein [Streptomyces niveus]